MDTSRWKTDDEFRTLDLVAQFRFKSVSSLSFDLGTKGDSLQIPDTDELWTLGQGRVFTVISWLDIHHPCEGHHRLQLRVGLPDRYVSLESMRDLVREVLAVLDLPADESYHISLIGLANQTSMEWPLSGFVS